MGSGHGCGGAGAGVPEWQFGNVVTLAYTLYIYCTCAQLYTYTHMYTHTLRYIHALRYTHIYTHTQGRTDNSWGPRAIEDYRWAYRWPPCQEAVQRRDS